MSPLLDRLAGHWSAGWRDVLKASVAAGLSWVIAHGLLGHPQPVFAAIAAIVCLAPGLPSHGRQAVHMLIGITTGIVVGEALLFVPVVEWAVRIPVLTFVSMMIALSFGLTPVVAIQAGVSAVLVIAMGPVAGGPVRLMDAAVGVAVGLLFSQVLATPDPVHQVDEAARRLLRQLEQALAEAAAALAARDPDRAQGALRQVFAAQDSLTALGAGIETARSATRWSVRGRLAAGDVAEVAARYDRRATRLYASAVLFGEALANALRRGDVPPPELRPRLDRAAAACGALAGRSASKPPPAVEPAATPGWEACLSHLHAVEEALRTLQDASQREASP